MYRLSQKVRDHRRFSLLNPWDWYKQMVDQQRSFDNVEQFQIHLRNIQIQHIEEEIIGQTTNPTMLDD